MKQLWDANVRSSQSTLDSENLKTVGESLGVWKDKDIYGTWEWREVPTPKSGWESEIPMQLMKSKLLTEIIFLVFLEIYQIKMLKKPTNKTEEMARRSRVLAVQAS